MTDLFCLVLCVGSPWKDRISLAILELQEKGEIQMIYDKWWKSPGLTCIRDEINKEGKASPLGLENIGGVFVVLMFGLALALFTAMFEFFFKSKKNAKKSRVSYQTSVPWDRKFNLIFSLIFVFYLFDSWNRWKYLFFFSFRSIVSNLLCLLKWNFHFPKWDFF